MKKYIWIIIFSITASLGTYGILSLKQWVKQPYIKYNIVDIWSQLDMSSPYGNLIVHNDLNHIRPFHVDDVKILLLLAEENFIRVFIQCNNINIHNVVLLMSNNVQMYEVAIGRNDRTIVTEYLDASNYNIKSQYLIHSINNDNMMIECVIPIDKINMQGTISINGDIVYRGLIK